ncbi:MAG: hypothetical protein U0414_06865 [Polyangiaceae bacterium]
MHARAIAIGLLSALVSLALDRPARADDDSLVSPVARIMFGPAFHVGSSPLVQFMLDADAGVMVIAGRNHSLYFDVEGGYSFDHSELHAFNLMGGIGWGADNFAYVVYQPRLLLGTLAGDFVVGMRNAVGGHLFSDMLDVELGHQFVSDRGHLTQSITATVGINPAMVLFLVLSGDND